jgi:pyridoxal 5'-phosphate synthase pdxS subunit
MDVVNAEQARIAEEAGACAVMALERVPADIRKDGGVSRMSLIINSSTMLNEYH